MEQKKLSPAEERLATFQTVVHEEVKRLMEASSVRMGSSKVETTVSPIHSAARAIAKASVVAGILEIGKVVVDCLWTWATHSDTTPCESLALLFLLDCLRLERPLDEAILPALPSFLSLDSLTKIPLVSQQVEKLKNVWISTGVLPSPPPMSESKDEKIQSLLHELTTLSAVLSATLPLPHTAATTAAAVPHPPIAMGSLSVSMDTFAHHSFTNTFYSSTAVETRAIHHYDVPITMHPIPSFPVPVPGSDQPYHDHSHCRHDTAPLHVRDNAPSHRPRHRRHRYPSASPTRPSKPTIHRTRSPSPPPKRRETSCSRKLKRQSHARRTHRPPSPVRKH